MKTSFVKKLLATLCVISLLLPMNTMTARAESTVGDWFDFETLQMQIEPGGEYTQRLFALDRYRVFQTGNTSQKTYVVISGKPGSQEITFHIGADETARRVTFWFYTWDHDIYQGINVDVVQPNPTNPVTKMPLGKADPAIVKYLTGSTGTLTTAFDGNVGLLSDIGGVPRAAFAIVSKENQLCPLQVYETVVLEGVSFPAVRTVGYNNDVTISIQEADKAAAQAVGIYGLFLNGRFVFWP